LLKILNVKVQYIHYRENFQGNSVFKGKRKLLKNRELPKHFQYTVYSLGGNPCHLRWCSL